MTVFQPEGLMRPSGYVQILRITHHYNHAAQIDMVRHHGSLLHPMNTLKGDTGSYGYMHFKAMGMSHMSMTQADMAFDRWGNIRLMCDGSHLQVLIYVFAITLRTSRVWVFNLGSRVTEL